MRKSNFTFEVLVNGKPVSEYDHEGSTFIEGRKGSPFELAFRNITSNKVLVVPSVDGVSTLNGKPAGIDSPGYIVQAYASLNIMGWTIDNTSVAEFMFQDRDQAYARETTYGDVNVGALGVLVFHEYQEPIVKGFEYNIPTIPSWQPYHIVGDTNGLPDALRSVSISGDIAANSATLSTSASDFEMGTGWGRKQDFNTNSVRFNKGNLAEQLVLFYDSRRNLEKRGIQVVKPNRETLRHMPQAFPTIGCTPPKGWTG